MMPRLIAVLSAGFLMTAQVSGAVTYTVLPNIPVFQGDLFPATERLDLNSDGRWDIEFYAHDDTFRISTNTSVEVFAIPATPPNLGGYLAPLDIGFYIGADSPIDGFVWFSGSAAFYSCALLGNSVVCLGLWGNGVDYLGFRIEEDDGFHYGYITVDTPFLGIHGGFIQGFGYMSSPDTGILAGAIPEPSTFLLALVGISIGVFKRRRPNGQGITSRDTATPISRPVYMIFRNSNLNTVIDTRPRFHEKDCQPSIEIHFTNFS